VALAEKRRPQRARTFGRNGNVVLPSVMIRRLNRKVMPDRIFRRWVGRPRFAKLIVF